MFTKKTTRFVICLLIAIHINFNSVNGEPKRIKFNKVVVDHGNQVFSIVKDEQRQPNLRILLAILVKNHAHSLPTFLATLETLECPTFNRKCDLRFVFEKNQDKSFDMVQDWAKNTDGFFNSYELVNTSVELSQNMSYSKIDSLRFALHNKFNYIFFINADNILTNKKALEILINKKKSIVAPFLINLSKIEDANFEAEDDSVLLPIVKKESLGCFRVTLLRDCFLVDADDENIKKIFNFKFDEDLNDDEFISEKAQISDIMLHVCNKEPFGYRPITTKDSLYSPAESFSHLRIEHLLNGPNHTFVDPLPISQYIDKNLIMQNKSKLGFDQIYVINLERRPDRKKRMASTLDELGISYKIVPAVDGKLLTSNDLSNLEIEILPNYKDPYRGRSLTFGEIGCFLSHYYIWEEMIKLNYNRILIFEDDARFGLNFNSLLKYFLTQMDSKNVNWEILYLGRKIMDKEGETWDKNVPFIDGYGIKIPSYTYWNMAYALTLKGTKKILQQMPLKKLIPVDELCPIMFDKHPNKIWSSYFEPRNLVARAIQPNIAEPVYFVKDFNYISDTENSLTIDEKPIQKFHETDESTLTTTFDKLKNLDINHLALDIDENSKTFRHFEL